MNAGLLITSENVDQWCGPEGATEFDFDGHTRVLNANQFPFCQLGIGGVMADQIELIPREQWPDLIAQKDRDCSWLDDLIRERGIPSKDQDGLGYCHGYGPVTALEVTRVLAGFRYVDLSAESVAGIVTNWANRGGDPEEDLQVLVERGACPADMMDRPNSRNPKAWKPGWEQVALQFKAEEFLVGRERLWDFACTCALRNIPTSPWFNWWSHCISGSYRLRYNPQTKKIQILNRNNWGDNWGDHGFAWFDEGNQRGGGTPSGIVAVRVATPAELAALGISFANAV